MVTNRKQHSANTRTKQGRRKAASQPNKISASTPCDFPGQEFDPIRRPAAGRHHAGETRLSVAGGRDRNVQARDQGDEHVSIRGGDRARHLRGVLWLVLTPLDRAVSPVDWDSEGEPPAAPVYAVAFPGGAAPECSATDPEHSAADAETGVGGGQREPWLAQPVQAIRLTAQGPELEGGDGERHARVKGENAVQLPAGKQEPGGAAPPVWPIAASARCE